MSAFLFPFSDVFCLCVLLNRSVERDRRAGMAGEDDLVTTAEEDNSLVTSTRARTARSSSRRPGTTAATWPASYTRSWSHSTLTPTSQSRLIPSTWLWGTGRLWNISTSAPVRATATGSCDRCGRLRRRTDRSWPSQSPNVENENDFLSSCHIRRKRYHRWLVPSQWSCWSLVCASQSRCLRTLKISLTDGFHRPSVVQRYPVYYLLVVLTLRTVCANRSRVFASSRTQVFVCVR